MVTVNQNVPVGLECLEVFDVLGSFGCLCFLEALRVLHQFVNSRNSWPCSACFQSHGRNVYRTELLN